MPLRPTLNLIPIPTNMHTPRPIRPRLAIPILPLNLPLQRRIRSTHNRISQIIKTVIIMYQTLLIERRVARSHLHRQPVQVHLYMEQAVHLMEDGENVSVFSTEALEFVKVHWGREGERGVGGDFEEAAAFGGEGHPVLPCGVHGGLGFVVGGVARVFEELFLVLADCLVLAYGF